MITVTLFVTSYHCVWKQHQNEDFGVRNVTIVALLATPDEYYGKFVRVIGVGWVENEAGDQTNELYLTKDDCRFSTWNSVFLEWGGELLYIESGCRGI